MHQPTSATALGAGDPGAVGARIWLDRIRKDYGSSVAIANLSLEIRKGEFFSLLGPSGSGKSTLLMMIAGFEHPTSGDIVINEHRVTVLPPEKRNIGMVFQSYALFPHMTVGENVGFALKQRGVGRDEIRARVRKALDQVQLSAFEGRFPQQLSGGQQQRVAIARAVIFDPPVLLMDEPLSALDKQLREEMQLEIKRLHDRLGITFVYVTHDQKEALVMSDRVAVLNHGEVEQVGSPTALYDEPENQFVASFIGEANFLAVSDGGAVTEHPGGSPVRTIQLGDLRLKARSGGDWASGRLCMVRPEKIRMAKQGQADAACGAGLNRAAATVRETVFMGEAIRHLVEVAGQSVVVKQPHRAGLPSFAPGEAAVIEWAVADTRLV